MAVPTDAITGDRLEKWRRKLFLDHATPLLLLGIGHDHTNGRLVICTVDDPLITNETIAGFLRAALYELELGRG